ncbi:MAG: hypothetical protein MZU79_02090 [Anaerotruncus sp.]|nr:hypothetical protein [Anaerotruncus sp.]
MGIVTAIVIAIHISIFPKDMATFMVSLSDLSLGLSIAMAIAIHNIPEGISVALPVYHALDSKEKSRLGYTFLSGMAEPLGAIDGFLLLRKCFK